MSTTPHRHDWKLAEDGYFRTWATQINTNDAGTITELIATYSGTDDWSEEGDGRPYLYCTGCSATSELPEGTEITYR